METSEYEKYNEIAKQKKSVKADKSAKKKVEVWQLVFGKQQERIKHGAYALCASVKNTLYKNDNRYRIIPM